jgi:TPR repeat protein
MPLRAAKPTLTLSFAETLAAGKAGDPRAQFNLGIYYMNGEGVAKDPVVAVSWYTKAAAQGNASAQNNLGICCATGNGTKLDPAQAIYWWKKSATQNDSHAACGLGRAYATGSGAPKDLVQSIFWYRRSAGLGYGPAQLELARAYSRGEGVTKDLTEAIKWYRQAAVGGNVFAQSTLGTAYATGLGVSRDVQEAVKWYRRAADGQDAEAQKALGDAYVKGEGVPRDNFLAYAYLSLASPYLESAQQSLAELSMKMSPNEIATGKLRYAELLKKIGQPPVPAAPAPVSATVGPVTPPAKGKSKGTSASPESRQKDLDTFLVRAKAGDSYAQWRLGFIYEQGLGVPVDYVESARWWRMAADQGHAGAQFSIGYCYGRGEGVPRDLAEAVRWYRKSSAQGYMSAHRFLGAAYAFGSGVTKDETEAYAYLSLADSSDSYVRGLMGSLASKLTSEAVLRGRQRAKELQQDIDAKKPNLVGRSEYTPQARPSPGTEMSPENVKVFKELQIGADQGYPGAQFGVGCCYSSGVGAPRDQVEACKWWRRAADQGHLLAQYSLGMRYATGQGVALDDVEAFTWLTLSATADSSHTWLSKVEAKLSPEGRQRGEQRAKQLQDEIEARKSSPRTKDSFDKLEQSRKAKEAELMRKGA